MNDAQSYTLQRLPQRRNLGAEGEDVACEAGIRRHKNIARGASGLELLA
jgi:hypothetical protein